MVFGIAILCGIACTFIVKHRAAVLTLERVTTDYNNTVRELGIRNGILAKELAETKLNK